MVTRRQALGLIASTTVGSVAATSTARADHAERGAPEEVTLSYDEELIRKYQPSLVLEGINPRPNLFHALHAESSESTLNAVYGFTEYTHQEGTSAYDSHLGDHEPIIVWYDQSSGDVVRVDYAAYHWFRGTASSEALSYATEDRLRPVFRVDKTYHHYYQYHGDLPGERVEVTSLLDTIESWLNNGLEDSLAPTQPYDPYDMLSRESWWRHNRTNWFNALIQSFWFNVGVAGATETSDLEAVSVW